MEFWRLLSVLAAFDAVFQCAAAQTTVNCDVDTENEACCEMEEGSASRCLFHDFIRPGTVCSVACKKRYQNLGYQCWKDYNTNFMWAFMETACDPTGIVDLSTPPTTSFQYSDYDGKTSDAVLRGGLSVFVLAALLASALR